MRPGQPEAAQLAAREAILSLGLFLPAAAVLAAVTPMQLTAPLAEIRVKYTDALAQLLVAAVVPATFITPTTLEVPGPLPALFSLVRPSAPFQVSEAVTTTMADRQFRTHPAQAEVLQVPEIAPVPVRESLRR